ncbi:MULTISPECIES: Calx-beta domain-containing protein [Pirellulaceae]|nr:MULTISPECIES: Calx-beta domain-containing protein [Pirellulaceae]
MLSVNPGLGWDAEEHTVISATVCFPEFASAENVKLQDSVVLSAIDAISTTGSDVPIYRDGEVLPADSGLLPATQQSSTLINIDDFRADPRFSLIDGYGFSTVILDTGIDLDHPFFGPDLDGNGIADRIVYSYDFADGDSDASDLNGHGSNVSSIVASSDTTWTGMAPGANIIHLKVFTDSGNGSFGYVEQALQWVVNNVSTYNIASVNMSLGNTNNYTSSQTFSSTIGINDELAALAALDVIVASSSGNDFFTFNSQQGVAYPAADPNSLSVGAVYDTSGSGFTYSSGAQAYTIGPGRITPFSQRHPELTSIMAPGAPITGAGPTGGLVTQHGTSQASPHIAGIAALAQQLASEQLGRRLTVSEFASLLKSTATIITDGDDENDNVINTGLTFPLVDVFALAEAIVDLAVSTPTATWNPLGPFGASDGQVENVLPDDTVVGAIHTVLAHPLDPNILYIGGTNGGIWRTTNATAIQPNWEPLSDQLPSSSIGAMVFDRADNTSQTIYAGIGRYSSFGRIGNERIGLVRTTDGGDSWSIIDGNGTLTGKNISGVYANGNTIIVSVNTADIVSASNVGIFRSVDGGATFQLVSQGNGFSNGLPAGVSYDLVADPINPDVLYTSMVFSDLYGGGASGVYRTTDRGATWVKVSSSAMDQLIDNGTTNRTGTSNLEFAVGTSNNVYVSIINEGRVDGLFRSGDGGTSWTQMDTPSTNENGTDVGLNPGGGKGPTASDTPEDIAGGQGTIHFSIVADPVDPNIVYVGGDRQPLEFQYPTSIGAIDYSGRLFRGDASLPTGSQWVHLTHSNTLGAIGGGTANGSSPHADSRDMVFDALGNIIEVDDGGIYRRSSPRSNLGDWFSVIGDLQVTEIHDVAYDAISQVAISGNQDTGTTQQSTQGAELWQSISTGDGGDVAVDDITLASFGQSIRYSSYQNLGQFQRRVYDSFGNLLTSDFPSRTLVGGGPQYEPAFRNPIELNVVDPTRIVFQGSNGVYESTDQGDTISYVSVVGGASAGNYWINQNALVAGGYRNGIPYENVLWVGADNSVFYRGETGTDLLETPVSAPVGIIHDLTVDPDDWTSVFVIDDNSVTLGSNAGTSWADITGNLGEFASSLTSLLFVEGSTTDALIVGTNQGVFASSLDALGLWRPLAIGLPNVLVYDMEWDVARDVLVAGTLGRGAWILDEVSAVVDDLFSSTDVSLEISAANAVRAEGGTGAVTPFTYTVTRSGDLSGIHDVDFSVVGIGVNPADLADFGGLFPSGTIHFDVGEVTQTITIDVVGDYLLEADEEFIVTLTNATGGALITSPTASGMISNDDATLSIVASDASRFELDSGTQDYFFTITRSGFTGSATTVDFTVAGTGAAPADINDFGGQFPSGSVTFAVGETTKSLVISATGDMFVEANEQFAVTLANPTGGTQLATPLAIGTILTDDASITLETISQSLREGQSGSTIYEFVVARIGNGVEDVTFDYAITGFGSNPADAADFGGTLPSGTATLVGNQVTISIPVNGDTELELDEEFLLTISNASNGYQIQQGTAIGTISNDDSIISLSALSSELAEGLTGTTEFLFQVSRTGDLTDAVSVNYIVAGAGPFPADATDFVGGLPTGSIQLAANQDTVTFVVQVSGDTMVEEDEQFSVSINSPTGGAQLGIFTATATLLNDDSEVAISPLAANVAEGDAGQATYTFTVVRNGDTDAAFSVDYNVLGSGANPADGADFGGTLPAGTIAFAQGEVSKTLTIQATGDTLLEQDESFEVRLTNATGPILIEQGSAVGTIINDDATLSLATVTLSQLEGNSTPGVFAFTVVREGWLSESVSVDYSVVGSGTNPAQADDFGDSQPGIAFPSGTLTFAAGENSKVINIPVYGDLQIESEETFTLSLTNPSDNLFLVEDIAVGKIQNDDSIIEIVATIANASEGSLHAYSIRRSGYLAATHTLSWEVAAGQTDPAEPADFIGGAFPANTAVFAPGQTSKLVTFSSADDQDYEPDEQFVVVLTGATNGAQLGVQTVSGTILNNDQPTTQFAPLDINKDGLVDASTDGNLLLSVLFGLPETSLTPFMGSSQLTGTEVVQNVANLGNVLDVNEDGSVDASTDGNLILVVLFDLPNADLARFLGGSVLSVSEVRDNVLALTSLPASGQITSSGDEAILVENAPGQLLRPDFSATCEPDTGTVLRQLDSVEDQFNEQQSIPTDASKEVRLQTSDTETLFEKESLVSRDYFYQSLATDESANIVLESIEIEWITSGVPSLIRSNNDQAEYSGS